MHRITINCSRCATSRSEVRDTGRSYSLACSDCGAVITKIEEFGGYIYILTNPVMLGIVKIGFPNVMSVYGSKN